MHDLDPLADLLDSAPTSEVERAERWLAAVEAVRRMLRIAASRSAEEALEVDAAEERLRAAFGSAPPPPQPPGPPPRRGS